MTVQPVAAGGSRPNGRMRRLTGARIVFAHAAPRAPIPSKGLMTSFQRLSSTRDIRAVFAGGAVEGGRAMTVHTRRRAVEGPARATVVAGRRVGGAVERNRVKRRLRAALSEADAPGGLDVIVVGRPPALTADFAELTAELRHLLARASRSAGARGLSDRVAG